MDLRRLEQVFEASKEYSEKELDEMLDYIGTSGIYPRSLSPKDLTDAMKKYPDPKELADASSEMADIMGSGTAPLYIDWTAREPVPSDDDYEFVDRDTGKHIVLKPKGVGNMHSMESAAVPADSNMYLVHLEPIIKAKRQGKLEELKKIFEETSSLIHPRLISATVQLLDESPEKRKSFLEAWKGSYGIRHLDERTPAGGFDPRIVIGPAVNWALAFNLLAEHHGLEARAPYHVHAAMDRMIPKDGLFVNSNTQYAKPSKENRALPYEHYKPSRH